MWWRLGRAVGLPHKLVELVMLGNGPVSGAFYHFESNLDSNDPDSGDLRRQTAGK